MRPDKPIEIGIADKLLAEGRLRASRDQVPFMTALKVVIAEKLKAEKDNNSLPEKGDEN